MHAACATIATHCCDSSSACDRPAALPVQPLCMQHACAHRLPCGYNVPQLGLCCKSWSNDARPGGAPSHTACLARTTCRHWGCGARAGPVMPDQARTLAHVHEDEVAAYVARGQSFMPDQALTLAHVHEDGVAAVHVLVGQRCLMVPVPQRQRDAVAAQLRGSTHTLKVFIRSTGRVLNYGSAACWSRFHSASGMPSRRSCRAAPTPLGF